jgi:RNA polymerase primary sigma factor
MNDDENSEDERKRRLEQVLASLTARELELLRKRFGVNFATNTSLGEIGKQFVATQKRLREIEKKVLEKRRGNGDDPDDAA